MASKRLPVAFLCVVLLIAAWIVDLFTPQLFVAAILLNGPIALSGLALNTRLTAYLVVAAQIANIAAGYINGVQDHYHWDSVAIGDRVLSAASFLLVGFLTARAQEYARDAGSASERERAVANEKALRRSLEAVRATLNVQLVLRAIAREACRLFEADSALLISRSSTLETPDLYRATRETSDVAMERSALEPALASIAERAADDVRTLSRAGTDPVAHLVLDAHHADRALYVRLRSAQGSIVLFVFSPRLPGGDRMLQTFADGASVALDQAHLFMQLGYRNEQIVAQRDALERSARVIRDIVYALAHDLRTPLAAANVTMQQALDGKYGELPQQYREILRTTIASNADVRRLVDTLLLVARFESGETSARKDTVRIADEVERVAEELRPIADSKGVRLRAGDGEPAFVQGDEMEIRRAIMNLTANAIAATPPDGTVTVQARNDGANVSIRVEDDGYGIPPEQRDALFERFHTVERGAGSGTGLGLYIVRLIAEKYGGSVSYSAREPRGSVFTIALPRTNDGQ